MWHFEHTEGRSWKGRLLLSAERGAGLSTLAAARTGLACSSKILHAWVRPKDSQVPLQGRDARPFAACRPLQGRVAVWDVKGRCSRLLAGRREECGNALMWSSKAVFGVRWCQGGSSDSLSAWENSHVSRVERGRWPRCKHHSPPMKCRHPTGWVATRGSSPSRRGHHQGTNNQPPAPKSAKPVIAHPFVTAPKPFVPATALFRIPLQALSFARHQAPFHALARRSDTSPPSLHRAPPSPVCAASSAGQI